MIILYRYYRRRPLTWAFLSVFFSVAIIIGLSVTLRYTSSGGYSSDSTRLYSPTDTRIVPVNNILCQSLGLSIGDDGDYEPHGYVATLYILNTRPKLTGRETFTFSVHPSSDYTANYKFYYFYLHPGSNFTVSACITDMSSSANFYLFKGQRNFQNWQDNEYSTNYKDFFFVDTMCSDGNKTKSYSVGDNDDYYYLVYSDLSFVTDGLNVTATFHRTRYEIDNSTVIDFCSENSNYYGASCSLSVPFSGHTGYLAITPASPFYFVWTDGIDVDTVCGARIWMYAIISICALVGAVGVIATVIVVCVCVRRKRKQNRPTTSASTNAVVATTLEEPVAPLLSDPPYSANPPLTNPNYQPVPGGAYGSSAGAPPAYKP